MAFYRCSICDEDGGTVAKDITVTIEETQREGIAGWYGTITTSHLTDLATGHRYCLTLADGRTGEFLVRRNTFAGETSRAVAINGTGPLEQR